MVFEKLQCVLPEIWLFSSACLSLLLGLFLKRGARWINYGVAQLGLTGALFCLWFTLPDTTSVHFYQQVLQDPMGGILKFLILIGGVVVFSYSRASIFNQRSYPFEYFPLCLFSILGMMVLVSSASFLTLYLGIELLALPLYALIPILKNRQGPEAAIKYFIMGALASALLLYGVSLFYGVTGHFEFHQIAEYLSTGDNTLILLIAMALILAGLSFKLGTVPFHVWMPDVYEGAPLPMTLFIGTLPKLAAFGFAVRLLHTFPSMLSQWKTLWIVMGMLSLVLGNLAAIVQTNLKRMLAYSGIAQIGFVALGLSEGTQALGISLTYLGVYVLSVLCVLGLLTLSSQEGLEVENIEDLKGVGVHHPYRALLLALAFLSLIGIPPFAGFFTKLLVLEELIRSDLISIGVFAVLLTVVGASYYLNLIRVMFFDTKDTVFRKWSPISIPNQILLFLNGVALITFGVFLDPLYTWVQQLLALS